MVNHGQPWLTEVPFHKPMVDHGWPWFGKALSTMVDHGCDIYGDSSKLSMVNHGYKHFQPWLTMVNHANCN